MDAMEMDPQVRAGRTWDALPAAPASAFRHRLSVAVQEGVLIGVKWLIVSLIALFGVVWFIGDYAAVREQARYVAQIRQAAQAQAKPARPAPPPTAGVP